MMFSGLVGIFTALLSMPPGVFIPLLAFSLIFWMFSKIFQAVVLQGSWIILSFTALGLLSVLSQMIKEEQPLLVFVTSVPLFFVGKEVYRRLVLGR